MEEGVYRDIGIPPLFDIPSGHIIGYVVDIGGHANVIAGYSLGKASGSTGVEDIGEVLPWIDFHFGMLRWVLQEVLKMVHIATHPYGTLGDLVKEGSHSALPEGEEISQVCNNGIPQACFGEYLLYIAEIRILADDRFSAGVVNHIFDLIRGIDGGYRYRNGSQFLNP